jgi:hypothetical protein
MKREVRFFNTTGPCNPDDHYMLPPEERLVGAQLHRYIRDKLYWSLHAPRQTGKTTFLLDWMKKINAGDEAVACYVSVEAAQGLENRKEAIPVICDAVRMWAAHFGLPAPDALVEGGQAVTGSELGAVLRNWAALVAPKPLVVLFDEVDVLRGGRARRVSEAAAGRFRRARRGAVSRVDSAGGDARSQGLHHRRERRRAGEPRIAV